MWRGFRSALWEGRGSQKPGSWRSQRLSWGPGAWGWQVRRGPGHLALGSGTWRGSIPAEEMAGRSSWICSVALMLCPQDRWESLPCFTREDWLVRLPRMALSRDGGSPPAGEARSSPRWAAPWLLLQGRPRSVQTKGPGLWNPALGSAAFSGACAGNWEMYACVAAGSVIALSLLSAAWSRTQLFGPYPR